VVCEEPKLVVNLPVGKIVCDEELGLFKVAKGPEGPIRWIVLIIEHPIKP